MTSLSVIYEDQALLVLDKPSGMHSTQLPNSTAPSIAELLLQRLPELALVAERAGEAGLIHRLDFETSGVLVAAKSVRYWQQLRAAIQAGAIHKTYLALLEGKVPTGLRVQAFIGSPNRRAAKMRVYSLKPAKKQRALPAESLFDPLVYCTQYNCSLCRVTAATARRHQIRAHAAHAGHAFIGDTLYGSLRTLNELNLQPAQPMPSFVLHAHTVSLLHPESQAELHFESPAPGYLRQLFPGQK